MDINDEKTLIRTVVDPDPRHVKWINPNVRKGVERDVVITVGEGGGVWVNDRATGEFLWAMPFPYDTPNFILSDIDVKTGVATSTRRWCSMSPARRGSSATGTRAASGRRRIAENELAVRAVRRSLLEHDARGDRAATASGARARCGPAPIPAKLAGIAKIDMRTGEIHRIYEAREAGNGAMLATAGDLLFWGDIGQVLARLRCRHGQDPLAVRAARLRRFRRARSLTPSTASSTSR